MSGNVQVAPPPQEEMIECDGYESGDNLPYAEESSFSSLDDDGPIQEYGSDYDMGNPWDEAELDIIVSSNGQHYCIECQPWENDRAREYLRRLYQKQKELKQKMKLTEKTMANINGRLSSTPTHLRYKSFAHLRKLRLSQFALRIILKKLNAKIQQEAHLFLRRMNGKK